MRLAVRVYCTVFLRVLSRRVNKAFGFSMMARAERGKLEIPLIDTAPCDAAELQKMRQFFMMNGGPHDCCHS